MNDAHLHLLVNHLPVFGIALGMLALLWAMIRNSVDMRWAAILLFVFTGATSWVANETGESAEEIAEQLPGVTKAYIHEHEEAAEFANIFAIITAAGAIVLAGVALKKQKFLKVTQGTLLLLSAITTAAMLKTANLGGQVRHTEMRSGAEAQFLETDRD